MSDIFRIAISGSRTITDRPLIYSLLDDYATHYLMLGRDLVFHLGDARGVDHLALQWARDRGMPRRIFFADRKGFMTWQQSQPFLGGPIVCGGPELELAILASDWDDPRDGDNAGRIRNHAMIAGLGEHDDRGMSPRADLLIAVHPASGVTPGTRNAIATAKANRVAVVVREVETADVT